MSEFDDLCQLIADRKVALWAGSGFSRYAGYLLGSEFAYYLNALLEKVASPPLDLQVIADRYIEEKGGGEQGREALISEIISQYSKSPTTNVIHQFLSDIWQIDCFITTNYDTLFESAYGENLISIIKDEEIPTLSGKRDNPILLKIHGDVNNPNRIVVTTEDFKQFDENTFLWKKIGLLLAENSVVFIGYSLADLNVRCLLSDILQQLGAHRNPYYIIDSDMTPEKKKLALDFNLIPIEMDGGDAVYKLHEYIARNAAIDSLKNPDKIPRYKKIFQRKRVGISYKYENFQIKEFTVTPLFPEDKIHCSLRLEPKINDIQFLNELDKISKGDVYDSLTLRSCNYEILLRSTLNGITLVPQSFSPLDELTFIPHPTRQETVDIELSGSTLKIPDVTMKIFQGLTAFKMEFCGQDFVLSFRSLYSSTDMDVSLKTGDQRIKSIERGRLVFTIFDEWFKGVGLDVIPSSNGVRFKIPSPDTVGVHGESSPVEFNRHLFEYISIIQTHLKVKIGIPESISEEEWLAIEDLAILLKKKQQKIKTISLRVHGVEQNRKLFGNCHGFMKTFSLTSDIEDKFTFFGKTFNIPIRIEGKNVRITNYQDFLESLDKELDDLHVEMKSENGMLYKKIDPKRFDAISKKVVKYFQHV